MFKSLTTYSPAAKKMFTSILLVSMGVFAIASMGGGGSKSKDKTVKPEFTPIRTTNGFTLKSGPVYRGSLNFVQQKSAGLSAVSSIATYQKGNTIYIIPCKYKLQPSTAQQNSSLQLLNLKIKIHK